MSRDKEVGERLISAAAQLLANAQVEVVFVWAHGGNKTAMVLYERAIIGEVDQLTIMVAATARMAR